MALNFHELRQRSRKERRLLGIPPMSETEFLFKANISRKAYEATRICSFCVLGMVLVLMASCTRMAYAQEYTDEQIVAAIGKAENSHKYPYGIRSVKCSGSECRQICLNSVRNAYKRWVKAGRPEDFITFMGRRYSPPESNPNWVRLVLYFLNKENA